MKKIVFISILVGLIVGMSCNKTDPMTTDDRVNNWMYANMDFWYYWADHLPKKPKTNQYPGDFFESLLYSGDRFSFIYDDYEKLVALLSGVSLESGFEFKLYYASESSTNLIMQLVYIKQDSPADGLGLKRGDIIDKINGTQLTDANYQSLLGALNSQYTATYRRYNSVLEDFESKGTVNITPIVFSEHPILLDSVYELEGKKIGYLVYTFFSPGATSGSTAYDDAVDLVFADFQSKGIDELIVDLRFNSGGNVSSAINLASLMVDGATSADVMMRRSYNSELTNEILNDPRYGNSFLVDNFLTKSANVGSQLVSGKVHFITSDRTASASELVLNSLRPFMPIFTVGETTVGKDVGSVTLTDDDNAKNKWAIQPIVVKLVNRDNQEYPEGFTPDVPIDDDFLILQPLGDINEPLLNATLTSMGIGSGARRDYQVNTNRRPVYQSINKKAWNQRMVIPAPASLRKIIPEDFD